MPPQKKEELEEEESEVPPQKEEELEEEESEVPPQKEEELEEEESEIPLQKEEELEEKLSEDKPDVKESAEEQEESIAADAEEEEKAEEVDMEDESNSPEPGHLTYEQKDDFTYAMATFYDTGDEAKLLELFKIFDRDGNGYIEKVELQSVMSDIIGDHVTDEEVNAMMFEADDNTDG